MYCAVNNNKYDNYTCFEYNELKEIAKALNINVFNTKEELWNIIYKKLKHICKTEYCWLDQPFIKNINDINLINKLYHYTFKPKSPLTNKTWLNTNDINNVMNQYQLKYKTFKYLGAVPSDFYKYTKIDYSDFKKYKTIGIILNLDSYKKPGSHWVALYIDNNLKTIEYFDSVGNKPNRNIKKFIDDLYFYFKNYKYLINRNIHQKKNYDCGVYAIHYLIQRLHNKKFKEISKTIISDDKINKYREYIFRQ